MYFSISNNRTTSNENALSVVKPPNIPVIKNNAHWPDGLDENQTKAIPIRNEPKTLTTSVPVGKAMLSVKKYITRDPIAPPSAR